ncbi:formate/nitrite transporter family protein [Mangrovicoccus algicola]|uniref:Formate/nitrite transporter family protein n=1 Tax=Mangrovicoccus algicola TaxID=2771008 RepID=A0A8J7CK69_9RHOB|nr:formate/nitrite transporter family protein [Mangrovicoccus algicola]MBE3638386.1 formate/nitrite transporter family protein [Mangrovicoccus algicola]
MTPQDPEQEDGGREVKPVLRQPAEIEEHETLPDDEEEESVSEASSLSPRLIYEVVRRDGDEELNRPASALIWSGVAAGILISASVMAEAALHSALPDAPWREIIENAGYSLGFMIVILGRMQLFTENTITTVLPFLARPGLRCFGSVMKLWSIVLAANVVGAFVAGWFLSLEDVLAPEVRLATMEISLHALDLPPLEAFLKGIPAGVLIAALVWLLPQAQASAFFVIGALTWMIAMGGFTHVIAGSVELAIVVLDGRTGLLHAFGAWWLPVLAGNILGGTAVFTALAWAQVRMEVRTRNRTADPL